MKKILFITIFLITSSMFAQTPLTETDLSDIVWGDQPIVNIEELNNVRNSSYDNIDFNVKLYIHVLRYSDGTSGQSVENVNRMLQILYDDFDPLGIRFVNNTQYLDYIDYIDNDAFFVHPKGNYEAIFNTNNHLDGIDIYLFDDLHAANNGGVVVGVGQTTAILMGGYLYHPSKQYFSPLNRTRFISQLMGRILYLYHTHFGTNGDPNGCPELVNGTNCNDCGDYICDTPADPNIFFNVNTETCVYEPNPNDDIPDEDINGDPYQPDTNNIMSFSLPSCWESFSPKQIVRMKNALGYLPHLQQTHLTDYTYIRPEMDCYTCNYSERYYRVYSSKDLSHLYPISSANVLAEIEEQTNDYLRIKVSSLLENDEGEPGYFSIVDSGRGMIIANQHIWVGMPETILDNTLSGNETAYSNEAVFHVLENRIKGIEFYNWYTPEPSQIIWGGETVMPTIWSHYGYDKFYFFSSAFAGNQTGYVTVKGQNPCGEGSSGGENEICVENSDDPEGDMCNSPIIYYPNPADSLLSIDLSLQVYDIFTVTVYNDQQVAVYTDQSENVVKTVDTFNLSNGTYYLHIYDSSDELILSRILIINH